MRIIAAPRENITELVRRRDAMLSHLGYGDHIEEVNAKYAKVQEVPDNPSDWYVSDGAVALAIAYTMLSSPDDALHMADFFKRLSKTHVPASIFDRLERIKR